MYLKLVYSQSHQELDTYLIEADQFRWGWRAEWPAEYWLPFPLDVGETAQVLVIEIWNNGVHSKDVVLSSGAAYIMGADGNTIDKFAA